MRILAFAAAMLASATLFGTAISQSEFTPATVVEAPATNTIYVIASAADIARLR